MLHKVCQGTPCYRVTKKYCTYETQIVVEREGGTNFFLSFDFYSQSKVKDLE